MGPPLSRPARPVRRQRLSGGHPAVADDRQRSAGGHTVFAGGGAGTAFRVRTGTRWPRPGRAADGRRWRCRAAPLVLERRVAGRFRARRVLRRIPTHQRFAQRPVRGR
ncbi:hypothetical protein G6F23_015725 [Rhizopus arrhizus]|nr:hypothetical protein G6F23_015725 [Rhizopus arrhizus]